MKERLSKANIEDILPLLPLQQSMLYQYLSNPNPELFNEINCYNLQGNISVEAFVTTWKYIIATNGVLRTIFRWDKLKRPVQIVLKDKPPNLQIESCSVGENCQDRLDQLCFQLKNQPYDLQWDTLRIKLFRIDEENAVMIVANHHILFDGWSNAKLIHIFKETYEMVLLNKELPMRNQNSYSHFVNSFFKSKRNTHYDYWRQYLSRIPSDAVEDVNQKVNKVYCKELPVKTSADINMVALRYDVSPAVIFYLGWAIVIKMTEWKNKSVFGVTFSGRSDIGLNPEDTLCLLITTLPFIVEVDDQADIGNCIKQVMSDLNSHQDHEPVFLLNLYQELNIVNTHLYESVVVIQNYPLDYRYFQEEGLLRIDICKRIYNSFLNMNLSIRQFGKTAIDLEYNSKKYKESDVKDRCELLCLILRELCYCEDETIKHFIDRISKNNVNYHLDEIGDFNI